VFLHYLVKIILSFFCAVSRWNLLMNYVDKQLNSVNHTKLYWSVYKQCSISTDERDMPVCTVISRGLRWLQCVFLTTDQLAFRWFEQILDVRCPAFSPLYRPSQFSWLDNQQLRRFHILFGNSFIIHVDPQPLWVRKLQIWLRSSAFKRSITIKAIKINKKNTVMTLRLVWRKSWRHWNEK